MDVTHIHSFFAWMYEIPTHTPFSMAFWVLLSFGAWIRVPRHIPNQRYEHTNRKMENLIACVCDGEFEDGLGTK